jgi:biopolymer transport protein ExbD
VALPKTSTSPEALKQNAILTIKKDGSIYVNKVPADLTTLGTQLAYEMRHSPQDVVVVNADENANYGLIIRVMNQARQIGVRKFALATEAEGERTTLKR